MKKKLIVRDEAKQHLKKMYDILDSKILNNEQLFKTTAGVEPCGAYCMVTCAFYCRPSCATQCEEWCITGTMFDCATRCGTYKAIYQF